MTYHETDRHRRPVTRCASVAGSLLLAATLALGCGRPAALADLPEAAVATLRAADGSEILGTVRFAIQANGVRVVSDVSGLPPGRHAYHVHVYGDCSASDASSAGTHFNFLGSSLDPPEDIDRITGNLGELMVDAQGEAHHEATLASAELVGPKSIIGRAVVVHARANDPEQPPIGAAGSRIACGVIGVAPADAAGESVARGGRSGKSDA